MLSFIRKSSLPLAITASSIFTIPSPFASCTSSTNHHHHQICRGKRSNLTNIQNKIVLITGATAGIGASCAMRFAEEGSKLILVGRRTDRLEQVKNEILKTYPLTKIHCVTLSVTDYDAVASLPNKLPKDFQDVDILVNNAGLALGVTSVDQNNINDAKQVLDTNVLGTIALCSAFVPGMKQRGRGHIVNMGSVAVSFHFYLFYIFNVIIISILIYIGSLCIYYGISL
jgi:hypothetical protein